MLVLRVKEVTFHKPDLFSPTPDSEAEGSQVHSATELMRLVSQHSGGKWVSVALGLQTEFAEFQDSQGYTEKQLGFKSQKKYGTNFKLYKLYFKAYFIECKWPTLVI